jgi:UDP-N-acetylglucosamine--N-acetylmuramyl-(pentapeptide) pyrophosphoryl-undecaprenol N-acetylglucosamine transferase
MKTGLKHVRVIITGGGTGGHIYPALAIAAGIRERYPNATILYVGTDQGLESSIVPQAGYDFYAVPAAGLERRLTARNLLAVMRAWRGFGVSWGLVRRFRPHVVVGTGGYVCGPVVLAAALQGFPTLIHEQNAVPGLTNRILSRYVSRTAVSFVDAVKYFPRRARVILTGLPVRPEILAVSRTECRRKLGLARDEFVVVSFGGSRGARSLNLAMVPVVQALRGRPAWRLYHAAGTAGYEEFLAALGAAAPCEGENIIIVPYFYEIATLLGAADLVVCRAGASTIAELTVLGRPSILVPYPYATDNHQEFNARALAERGAAVLIRDRELTGEGLLSIITGLQSDARRLAGMSRAARSLAKPRALDRILDTLEKLAGTRRK